MSWWHLQKIWPVQWTAACIKRCLEWFQEQVRHSVLTSHYLTVLQKQAHCLSPLKYLWTSMSYVRPYRVKIIMFRLLFYEKYYLRTIMSSILMCFVFVSLSSHSDRELCTVHWLTQLSYQHRLWKRPIRAQHWEATPPRQGTAHMTWLSFLCTLFMMDCYHVLFMYRSVCLSQ